ncbi:unnamed protein product [Gulo gulo]|uniref:Uncharacterized protein n=1 Tax=Gulo gulo TaxID=48420 RepID=A0A9X9MBY1_GULGU|nr:unnamed protein product [Gulo gulo]
MSGISLHPLPSERISGSSKVFSFQGN